MFSFSPLFAMVVLVEFPTAVQGREMPFYIVPFHLISTPPPPPPVNEVSKILTPKKKNQSADTTPPSEICKFSLPAKSKDADRLNR
jgi:hypothetical protein